ncbi:hemocyte protein-glutamine gamma-glutamyltransferase-like protein [Leptotrombidium deliense]|uniref:Hemocyte protein-glutamine gamma-glutamyltransferase-like protein n=1 Tax=Leptotrombidium deliense TaxID=299467 RepID=A0A443SNN0_9ACAR|nr:hemocyte protein-glutamine gamma-glutamyltransferase-like protein [Leptotrombidium deliense]
MGPASRAAVKAAEVNFKYDTGFAYGEVNADIIHRNYRNEVTGYFENSIGKLMLSKGLDGDVIDLTSEYKHPEGSLEERMSFNHAIKLIYGLPQVMAVTRLAHNKRPRDLAVNLTNSNSKQYSIGSKVYFDVLVRNKFSKPRLFNVSIDVYSLYYNGKRGNDILKHFYRANVPANSENVRRYEIDPKDYIYKLVPFSIVRVDILLKSAQRSPFKQSFDIKLKRPTLIIKPIGRAVIGKPFYVDVQLLNPLQVPITKCMFSVQGIRLNADHHLVKSVKPFENRIYRFALVFDEAITENVVFSFTSNELHQIQGSIEIKVNRK